MLRSLALLLALAPAVALAQPVQLAVESGGVSLPATLTLAADRGAPRPLAITLHGNPGGPLDQPSGIADALVASGVDVVRFTYRGLWGTDGAFTLTNSIADLDAVLDVVTAPAFAARLGHPPSSVVLVGYSYGTAASLVGADDRVDGVVALAPCDHGYFGGEFADPDSEIRDFLDRVTASLFGEGGPVEGGGPAFIGDLVSNAEAYGFPAQAERLLGTKLLLLGGMDDAVCAVEDHLVPIARRLRALAHPAFEARVLPMDHGFDGVGRDALMEIATDWIGGSFPTVAAGEVACVAAACAPGPGEEARVMAAEDAYVQAEIDGDEAALRRIVDNRFVFNRGNGTTSDKEALIATVLGFGMTGQTITERSVVVDGPTAVVTGTAELRFASDAGPDRAQTLRYTAVYVDRAGTWRLLGLHMSPRAPSR